MFKKGFNYQQVSGDELKERHPGETDFFVLFIKLFAVKMIYRHV